MKIIFLPFGFLYVVVNSVRRKLYNAGLFKSVTLKCPVISVGNLTMGGSGKTPFCQYLANFFEEKGKKVAIVLRGYKRKTSGAILLKKDHTWEEVGEEALIYKRNLIKSQVVVAEKREEALNVFKESPDVIILDDGFQHLRVKRDIDIVLVDANKPQDLLPYPLGKLREPLSSLKSASLVVVTKGNGENIPSRIKKYIGEIPKIFVDYDWNEELLPLKIPTSNLKEKRVLLLLGIGNPQFFVKQAENKKINIKEKIILPDHFFPDNRVLKKVLKTFEKFQCDCILTTEKDYIKLKEFKEINNKLLYPQLVLKLKDSQYNFEKIFSDILEK